MGKSILITGVSGLTGSYVAEYFSKIGWEVIGVSRNASKDQFLSSLGIQTINLDLSNPDCLDNLDITPDVVFNAAAYLGPIEGENSLKLMRFLNAIFPSMLLRWSSKHQVQSFFHVSSVAVYGQFTDAPISESLEPRPQYPYAKAKWLGEQLLLEEYKMISDGSHPIPKVSVFRPPYIVGKRDRNFAPEFIGRLLNGRLPQIGNGNAMFSFVHPKDIAHATEILVENQTSDYETYNIVSFMMSFKEFFTPFATHFQIKRFPQFRLPYRMAWTAGLLVEIGKKATGKDPTRGLSRYRVKTIAKGREYDCSKLIDVGFSPKYQYSQIFDEIVEDVKENPEKYGLDSEFFTS